MEGGIGTRPCRHRRTSIPEDALIGRKPVVLRIAQYIATVELVQGKSPSTGRQPHRSSLEKLLQLLHYAEDADLLMLPEIVDIPHSHDAFRSDGFVVRFDPGRHACEAE